jgi:hypothetical protein
VAALACARSALVGLTMRLNLVPCTSHTSHSMWPAPELPSRRRAQEFGNAFGYVPDRCGAAPAHRRPAVTRLWLRTEQLGCAVLLACGACMRDQLAAGCSHGLRCVLGLLGRGRWEMWRE